MSKQTLRSYCKSHLTLVWLCFIFTPLPVLCELIPLYSMCLLSFSLVRRLSPLPTLRDHVIQPEQYSNASCSHCSLGALVFFSCPPPPAVFVRNTVCQHLRKHLNKAWQGQSWRYGLPHSATFSFFHPHRLSHFSPLSSPPLYAPSFTLCISSTYLLSGPPLRSSYPPLQQMLLLSFTLFSCPPPVGDSIIFRHSWQCVAMFVCASLGSWPDFLVISMPTSFLTSPSSVAPDREITPVHGTVGVPAGPNTEEKQGGGEIQGSKEGMRYLGGEVNVQQLPRPQGSILGVLTSIKNSSESLKHCDNLGLKAWIW